MARLLGCGEGTDVNTIWVDWGAQRHLGGP